MRELEERALAAVADGTLTPAVNASRSPRPPRAHAALESRATTGKVVLVADYSLRSGVRSSGSASSISLVKMRSPRL